MPEKPYKEIAVSEGTHRERLARYFLSVPPYREQSPEQQAAYRRRLRELGQLDNQQVLAATGSNRPLTYGDPVPLLQHLLTAAQKLGAAAGQPLMIFPAKDARFCFEAPLHPRLLSLALMNLLRIACAAAPRQPVWVHIREQATCLTVTATATAPFYEEQAAAIIKECARLHGGNLARCDNSVGFSCLRLPRQPEQIAPYTAATADELYRDTLSPVWTGFYAWLVSDDSAASSDGAARPNANAQPNTSASNPSTASGKPASSVD